MYANAGVNIDATADMNAVTDVYNCVNMNVNVNININANVDVNAVTNVYNYVNVNMNADINIDANIKVNVNINANAATNVHNSEFFNIFLKTIKDNYEHCRSQLQAALEKLTKRYNAAKAKSILVLISFLNSINYNSNPLRHVRSDAKIHVQVKLIKHRKTESSVKKFKDKENCNCDSHVIPACKVRVISKKRHNLS
ncbi:19906_t:CDS:2 [Cetraspora pellucida]|uniref:19906_t:CDS:1 n=1 Tax=Cetraspora pellucida TaxID=1433469 RepID=A0A9N9NV52_9GLOM|nr:19906_t:CDS:2 [Cetraspora pellucida]